MYEVILRRHHNPHEDNQFPQTTEIQEQRRLFQARVIPLQKHMAGLNLDMQALQLYAGLFILVLGTCTCTSGSHPAKSTTAL